MNYRRIWKKCKFYGNILHIYVFYNNIINGLFNFNRYMATGESLRSLGFTFRISQSYITRIIQLVFKILSLRLPGILLKPPSKEDLIQIARDFWEKWNFPNCVGSIDGKHIRIFCPGKSGTLFFNYKDFFLLFYLANNLFTKNIFIFILKTIIKRGWTFRGGGTHMSHWLILIGIFMSQWYWNTGTNCPSGIA
ncbi:protein ANTAGONIST OF LIKE HETEROCHROMATIN PROTEIN 1-like [Aphis craccivora]|uniref:Protein ANTAGONIST OF LIKE HETEROCHROMATIN PROTEIN 1-like n=1 Tax=Aphis craccivora TaxID=307492 RepID=A0A6G0VWE6_APHCR|nr:protein ANTAGONIST OF LIKE HETEROCHROMATIN PROTEIN 1-like [Aphis craccivora]